MSQKVVVPAPPSVALRAPPSLACPAATKEPSVTGLLSLGGLVFFSGITGFETAVVYLGYGFYFFLSYGPYRAVLSFYLSLSLSVPSLIASVSPRVLLHLVFGWVEDQIWSELDAVTCVRFLGGLSLSGCGCSTAVSMGATSTLLINRFRIVWPPLELWRIQLNVVSRVSRAHCLDGCYFAYLLHDSSNFATQSSMFLLDR